MKSKSQAMGHLSALLTIVLWGTTFISTKILLTWFSPVEVLFFRFCIGLLALLACCPRRLRGTTPRQELAMAAAGLTGVTLYFLFENIALTYTLASNASVIVSTAPLFTALLAHFALRGERLRPRFLLGFLAALAGIALISFNGSFMLQLNPLGDMLALLAAVVWAVYSVLTRIIGGWGYHTILVTRRVFAYGLLFMAPALPFTGFSLGLERFANPVALLNTLFLGLGASALCFVTWNFSIKALGAVKTSVYIYGVPVVTIVTSILVLSEPISWIAACGAALTLVGLLLSQWQGNEATAVPEEKVEAKQ